MKNCNTVPFNLILSNVAIIRPVPLVLLIFCHAFAVVDVGWSDIGRL